jgi:hypothetical protein
VRRNFSKHWWVLFAAVATLACNPLPFRRPSLRVCLGPDWRTTIMEAALWHQASDSVGQSPRYFQQELRIDRSVPLRPILVRDDALCQRALAAFDHIDPRPDRRPRARGYLFRVGDNYAVRDPTDEVDRNDRWAYAAVFDADWKYHFYQGFYRCMGGSLPGNVDCANRR